MTHATISKHQQHYGQLYLCYCIFLLPALQKDLIEGSCWEVYYYYYSQRKPSSLYTTVHYMY